MTKEERDKLPAEDFGWGEKRLYPITTQETVDAAAHLIGKAPAAEQPKIKARIRAICKRKGLKAPESWTEGAGMSRELVSEFAVEGGAQEGSLIVKDVPVFFKADRYEFKDDPPYEMTNEDIMALCADFSPVLIEDNHRLRHHPVTGKPLSRSIFHGKLGKVESLTPSADYGAVGCRVSIPRQVKELYGDDPLGLSARFDTATKKLIDVALTPNPRITEAALFSACCEFAAEQEAAFAQEKARPAAASAPVPAPAAAPPPAPAPATFAAGPVTPHGQGTLQAIHDLASRSGAVCNGGKKSAAMAAEFTTEGEAAAIQACHDSTLTGGARCRLVSPDDPMVKPMEGLRSSYLAHFAAEQMTPTEKQLRAELDRLKAEREAEQQARRTAQFTADLEAGKTRAEAAFTRLWEDDRALPCEKPGLVGEYLQACLDDLHHGGEVQFSLDGQTYQTGTRERAVLERWQARPKVAELLTQETTPGEHHARFARETSVPDAQAVNEAQYIAALQATPQGRQILAERAAAARAIAAANGASGAH